MSMDRSPDTVNQKNDGRTPAGRRPYDSTKRQASAARNRAAIVDAAERRFLHGGYADTTVSGIAAEAGVSDHTIYKTFGGKPGLVRAIRATALLGAGPTPAEDRSDAIIDTEPDAHRIIAGWGALTEEVMPRVAPILLLIRDAATTDPEVIELLHEMDADRLRRMTDNARRLIDTGQLRPDLDLVDVADVLWTYSAPELYELVVIRRGWTAARYGEFISRAMIDALL